MGRLIVDAAASLDGFWADARGRSVLSAAELRGSGGSAGLSGRVEHACGAVVMSRRALELSDDAGWIAQAYPAEAPVFVVADAPLGVPPRGQFHFLTTYGEAFAAARLAAGDKAVLVVGEAGAVKAALRSGEAPEIWLRVVSRTLGQGTPLFEEGSAVADYFVSELDTTADAVHMHLERRLDA
ncbi:riboflavin biosynthesis protein RibD [Novosphingobium resinovorum]|uniref:riboflavin biosynthesis protein RibD n=1 Tax=Novosphingobium resinovorum TaxID=158500 RepID=UPI002ED3A4DD|nr:riboflavin biosynthesis protein RibD [Novosphingobium resinovorum]